MAKSEKTDRRAVIDQMRSRQNRAERARSLAIVGVCVLIALLLVGAAAYRPLKDAWDSRALRTTPVQELGAPASACGKIETKPASGSQQHIPETEKGGYTDSPPAFGKHWNIWEPMDKKLYSEKERPPLEKLVHNQEHGFTILWYDETAADDSAMMDAIRKIAKKYTGTDNQRLKFMAVPWLKSDGKPFPDDRHIAMTHWSVGGVGVDKTGKQVGVWQYCSEPSGAALETFMEKYPYMDSPEPGAV